MAEACLQYDAHVAANFRRVYGDEDGRTHRCLDCDSGAPIF
ncbi:DUF7563 family protein [Halorubrum salinarum]